MSIRSQITWTEKDIKTNTNLNLPEQSFVITHGSYTATTINKELLMNRIEKRFAYLKENNEKAFIQYITAGLPNVERTKEILRALAEGGADVVELGVPFSDPVADGPVIQDASYEALCNGMTLEKSFEIVKDLRDETLELPIIFMLYSNTVFHYGTKKFVDKCRACGVDGLIIPDLPLEEQGELKKTLDGQNDTILIELVSPVSKARVPKILEDARGFVYCVSSMGVTGQSGSFHKNIKTYLSEVKAVSKIPVMMGFGIRTPEDIKPVSDIIDGAIVGSYFIELMRKNDYEPNAAKEYAQTFKKGLRL